MRQDYLTGDYIIDSSCIYEITSIGAVKDSKGVASTYVYYRPIDGSDKVFTASIPIDNLKKSGTRKVLTLAEVKQIMKDLKSRVAEEEYNTMMAKEAVYLNDPQEIVSVLLFFWKNTDLLGKADRELMEQILEHLCQEMALVTSKPYANVRKEVTAALSQRIRQI